MRSDKEVVKISKFLSLVLRHQPASIGITLDENGWTDVNLLIEKSREAGVQLDKHLLSFIVETNTKKRFAFDETLNKIRANQGHSVTVNLGYQAQEPPEILYHGTAKASVEPILQTGLQKRNRHHVHLSTDLDTALKVGKRHGEPIIFQVLAGKMYKDNYTFFVSANNVWLTDHVPAQYLLPQYL